MKNSENKPKKPPKTLAKALAVCSTALCLSVALMGNSYPETDIMGVRPSATITDNVLGWTTSLSPNFPVEVGYDYTLYYQDEGFYEIEIMDAPLDFIVSVSGNYQILDAPILVYELRDFIMTENMFDMFLGNYTINSQEQYGLMSSYEYTIYDSDGEHSVSEGYAHGGLFAFDHFDPIYSPSAQMYYLFVEHLRIEIYLDDENVQQHDSVTLRYSDALGYSYITPLKYSRLYSDFLEYRGITVVGEIRDPVELLWSPIKQFLTTEIFPDFSIGTVLSIAVGLLCFGMFLKIFVGG